MAAQIDRLEIEIEAQASKANKQLDLMISKLNKLSGVLSGLNTSNIGNVVGSNSGVRSSTNGLKTLSNSMSRFAFSSDKASKSTKSLAAVFGNFYANCFLLIRGFKALGKAVEASMDYIETYNYYNVTMSKIASEFSDQWQRYGYESAENYGNSFAARLNELTRKMSGYKVGEDGVLSISGGQNLSLDPEQLMQYQSNVAAITNSVGLVGETSVNTAKALSMLAADMSSLKNIDMSTVMTNFQSGLIGQSRALYKYGIDITNATLQTYAYKYGLQTAVSEMTQADKMQLRLLAILDQSKVAWGDQASTLNSAANQYRILKQQIANLGRVIGNLLVPIVAKALPIINGITIALQRMFMFIGNLLGVDWSGIMDGISTGYGGAGDVIGDLVDDTDGVVDGTDGIGDSLDSATDKAKKLQRTILGFDEINKLNDNSDIGSSAGNVGTGTIDTPSIGGGIDLSDEIAKALADYESVWDKALKNSQNKAQEFADNICKAFEKIWKTAEPTRKAISNLWDNGLAKLGKFSGATLYDFWNNFLKPVGTWMLADNAGLPRFFNVTNDLLNDIDWGRLKSSLADFYTALQTLVKFSWNGLMDFYEGFMKPMSAWVMSSAIPQLVDIMTAFINNVDWEKILAALRNFWDAMAPFAQNVGQGLINFFSKLMEIGAEFLNTVVPGGLNGLADALNKISPEQAQSIGEALGKIALGVLALKGIATVVKGVAEFGIALAGLATGLGFLFGGEGVFAGIAAKISGFFAMFVSGGIVYEAIGEIGMTLSILVESFTGIAIPVSAAMAAVVAVIAGIAAALVDIWNTSETFRTAVIEAFTKVKDSLVGAFNKVKEAVSPLWQSIKDLGAAIYDFYEASGMKSVVALFATLAATVAGSVISIAIDAISTAFSGLAQVLTGAVDIITGVVDILSGLLTLDTGKIIDGFKKLGEGIVGAFDGIFGTMFDVAGDIIGGLLQGITDAVSNIGSWIKEHVVDPFISNVKSFFGINSPSTVMAEIGTYLMEGLLGGINGLVEDVIGVFSNIKDTISGVWDNITETASTVWNGITTTVGDAWDGLKAGASEKFNNIKESISGAWDKAKEVTGNVWGGIKSTAGGIWDWLTGKSDDDFPEIQKDVEESFESAENTTANTWSSSQKSVADTLKNMKLESSKSMQQVFKNVESYTKSIYNITVNNWNAIGKKTEMAMNDMNSAISVALNEMESLFSSFGINISNSIGDLYGIGQSAAQSFANGFQAVHIPIPQLYISSWNTHTLYNGGWFQTPNFSVNWYKKGGFFDDPTVIGVGEDGAEAVVPFERSSAMSKLASSIAKHMDGKELNTGRDLLKSQMELQRMQASRMEKAQTFKAADIAGSLKDTIQDAMMEIVMAQSVSRDDEKPYVLNVTVKTEDDETLARAVERGKLKRSNRFEPVPAY